MVASENASASENVEPIFGSNDFSPILDGLQRLSGMIAPVCPKDCIIKFDFDGKLHLHIDVRRFEEMTILEAILPTICGGLFRNVQRGVAERHSFFHRLTATVQR